MKKCLTEITEKECRIICEIYGEPFIRFRVYFDSMFDLAVSITTTTTLDHKSEYDSSIAIYNNGNVTLSRNNGDWNGHRTEDISPLMATDFLRSMGYEFNYELPKNVDRKIKLLTIKKI